MTVDNAFDNFIRMKYRSGLLETSIDDYRRLTKKFIDFIGNETEMENITTEDIEEYIDMMYSLTTLSRSTIASYLRNTRIFLFWYQKKHVVQYDAKEIKLPREPKKLVDIYKPYEIEMIFNAIHTCETWIDARNKAMICLMLDSGIRQAEVCRLKKKDVYFSESYMKVYGKGNKERCVPLGKMSILALKEYINICPFKSENMFVSRSGDELTCDSIKHMTYDMQKELPFKFSSHKLRHNFGTNYLINQFYEFGQMDIYQLQILMGHESITTTQKYLHIAKGIVFSRNSISHLDKLFLGTG